jgi:hypothetical protein
MFAHMIFFE